MTDTTVLPGTPAAGAPAGVRFQKLHDYDSFRPAPHRIETKESRQPFLQNIIDRCKGAELHRLYEQFHGRYADAIEKLGHAAEPMTLKTGWRTVVGWGTNPALESGIALHPLLGIPYAPGSQVRGLARAQAEASLIDGDEGFPVAPGSLPETPSPALRTAIAEAEEVRWLFGSLIAKNLDNSGAPPTAYERCRAWLKLLPEQDTPEAWQAAKSQLATLAADEGTGGRLRFFDAMPAPGALKSGNSLLEIDVLTVHYQHYYGSQTTLPTDDREPIPVQFLVLKAGTPLEFRFRYAPYRPRPCDEPGEWSNFREPDIDVTLEKVKGWLEQALATRGLGAKTNAGYGYGRPESNAAVKSTATSVPAGPIDLGRLPAQVNDVKNDPDRSAALAAAVHADDEARKQMPEWAKALKKSKKMVGQWYAEYAPSETVDGSGDTDANAPTDVHGLTVRPIAPAMLGGINTQDCDKPPTYRSPSMRGLLRMWTRAIAVPGTVSDERDILGTMQREESALWGNTEHGQRVGLIGSMPADEAKLHPSGFSRDLRMYPHGSPRELRLRVPEIVAADERQMDRLAAVLWVWLHLGGLGRRARRGYGALQWQPRSGDLIDRWLDVERTEAFASREGLEEYLRAGLRQALTTFEHAVLDAARVPSPYFRLASLDQVFVGEELAKEYVDQRRSDDTMMQKAIKGVRHDPDAGVVRSNLAWEQRQLGHIGSGRRLASPMSWRAIQLDNGHYVPVMTWSPHIERGERPEDVVRLQDDTAMYSHLTDTLGFAQSLAGGTLEAPYGDGA